MRVCPFPDRDVISLVVSVPSDISAATGVTILETYGELRLEDFGGGQDCLHPDDSGHSKIARLFTSTLR
jgi:hypothetical protein